MDSSSAITCSTAAQRALVTQELESRLKLRPTQPGQLAQQQPAPMVVHVHVQQEQPKDQRASTYITEASRGNAGQSLDSFKLPSLLEVATALVLVAVFLAGASMLSIGLTSYSDMVERRDENRSILRTDF